MGAMHPVKLLGVLLLVTTALYVRANNEAAGDLELSVEHSVSSVSGKRVFSPRGTLFYRDLRQQPADGSRKSPLYTSKIKLSGESMDALKKLVEDNGNYMIRVKSANGAAVTAYTRACALVASNFHEEWDVTMDQLGNVAAINYMSKNQDCSRIALQLKDSALIETSVKLAYPWRGIRPEVKVGQGAPPGGGNAGTPQPGSEGSSSGGGKDDEPKEEPSFLRKYWLYIAIPMVFMMMQQVPPEEGAGGGRPSGGPKPAPRRRPA